MAAESGVAENLLLETWTELDQDELRIVLQERLPGGRGQYDGGRDVLYLPLARERCCVALLYKEDRIFAIEPGEAFEREQWDAICAEIESAVLKGRRKSDETLVLALISYKAAGEALNLISKSCRLQATRRSQAKAATIRSYWNFLSWSRGYGLSQITDAFVNIEN